ncbi:MAG: efflux RND transporter periplasmic adaptor subunit [Sedimenticola sp.]|uniref:Efflux RND transporter periplasmic adaptor subunit n=1 Tax=Sedimenticola thiotaurini TaxID=1543721 RepID=A0A558D793_9GAMM|nr:efflux RND transporter periplasmic adaptor subunit [Sedimenticola sp.]MCW8947157.1 efflux RND transporter periplasmic adaptor subunit [Sedimenticola sp.]MCW8974704.1 efflux RND transporter periplasmic adaptor subunit [Sedimenticola sp.]MCW9022260.1 efflux RND transporter periplasmic adaptor subunit [Sedimenticola sp.]TVT56868.1 MAG: efflux RND transporter periplasmic adaptor subunit [Sedimenticola thiotaurini]
MAVKSRSVIFFVLIVAGLASSIWYFNRPKPISVTLSTAENGLVEKTVANTRAGTVKACRRAKLSPGTGGQIAQLDIHEGDHVKKGQLLLQLWNEDLMAQIRLSQAEARVATANARAACLQAEIARREADRQQRLHKKGLVSEESIDKFSTEAEAKKADCESANASTRAAADRVEVNRSYLERTQLFAPFDGIIAEINGELNEYVTPSPPGIATPPAVDLIDNSCFFMEAPIDEVDAARIKTDQPARVTLDAFDKRNFPGSVKRIAAYVLDREKQARTVDVEVEFSNPEDIKELLAGYSADVEIILETKDSALRIPTEAVIEDNQVYIFLSDTGSVEKREIEVGLSNWDYTEVLSGIKQGDQIITSVDVEGLEDGALAKAKESKKQ